MSRCNSSLHEPAITCSKLTIETLEQGVKYVQVNNKDTRTTSMAWSEVVYFNMPVVFLIHVFVIIF